MQEFTFGMLTYNQADYVFEHLESIKYQILNYGNDVKAYFVLSDDASKDNTVKYVKMWLDENKELFAGIKIVSKTINEGIVQNFLTLLKNINTSHYKILAGDDLYYKNNVFELVKQGGFIISPTIYFDGNHIICGKKRDRHQILLLQQVKGNLKDYLVKRLKYSNCIDAPGAFVNHDFIDQGLFDELQNYQWIEDVPMWNYLVNIEGLDVKIIQEPYILYRSEVGISKNKNHSARSRFEGDVRKIEKTIYVDKTKYPKIINPHSYRYTLEKLMLKYYWDKNSVTLNHFAKVILAEESAAESYLLQIIKNVNEWKDKHSINN